MIIKGAGGGGKGGGGSSHTPTEVADNLRSKAFAQVLDAVCEGEIEGLVDGLKSVYLDDTPLQNGDGSFNFTDVTVATNPGSQAQAYVPGFSAIEAETAVSLEVKKAVSITRQITNTNANAVRVTLTIPALTLQSAKTGDIGGTSVAIAIDVQTAGGGFVQKLADTITGKTSSQYQRSYRIGLTGTGPWDVRVRRITDDSTQSNLQNKTFFSSYTEIVDSKLRYPNTALVGIKIDASQFQNIPRRGYDLKLLKVKIPSNYNPVTRAYTGVWNGTFTVAWTDNPAWCFYDLLTNTRYGLGNYVSEAQVDKWALYAAGQYCDGMVPDGFGGTEPRFTCNLYIQSRNEAFKVLQDMASIFRSMTYWSSGAMTISQDSPQDSVYLYTPANVIDGQFTYIGASAKARHSVALVTWNDPDDAYTQKVEYVEDTDAIARFGVIQTDIVAIGCTSRGQANRVGRWLLYTEQMESEAVTFKTGIEGAVARPGQIISIADPTRAGARRGGRVVSGTTTAVSVDSPLGAASSGATLSIIQPTGVVEVREVVSVAGSLVTVTPAYSAVPAAGSIWVFQSNDIQAQTFRVMACKESDDGGIEVSALAYNGSKFAAIENGLTLQVRDITNLTTTPQPPTALTLSESLYLYQAEARAQITASWPAVTGATSYRVLYRKDNGNFITDETSANDFDLKNITPGFYEFRVYSVGASGNTSTSYTTADIDALGKTAPPEDVTGLVSILDPNIGVTLTWTRVADLDLDSYEIRDGATWATSTLLGQVKGTSFKVGLIQATTKTYLVKALDTSGNYSTNAASVSVTLATAAAPAISASFAGQNLVLTWNAVQGDLSTESYEIRYGASFAAGVSLGTLKGTSFATRAAWSGARTFWIAATDISGNTGAAGSVVASVTVPVAVTITQEVIDNNVLLKWGDATATLPIDYYELRKGATWAAATVIGRISSRFTVIFESSGGSFNYWIAGVDVAGNLGAQSDVEALVSQPPDYQLQFNQDSAFGGTKSSFVDDQIGGYLAPIDGTETWQSHFTSRGWASPQAQVTAGYPIYIQPSVASGFYEETFDYGTVLSATKITTTLTYAATGTVTVTPQISVRKLVTDPWIDYAGLSSVYVTDFRYVKVKYTFTQTGGTNFVTVSGLNVRFDVKLKNDAGTVAAVSTDVGGTVVPFNVDFVDVGSITVTPSGTVARIAIYDFVDVPNPTSFKVLLFDTSGTRVSGNASWSAKGV